MVDRMRRRRSRAYLAPSPLCLEHIDVDDVSLLSASSPRHKPPQPHLFMASAAETEDGKEEERDEEDSKKEDSQREDSKKEEEQGRIEDDGGENADKATEEDIERTNKDSDTSLKDATASEKISKEESTVSKDDKASATPREGERKVLKSRKSTIAGMATVATAAGDFLKNKRIRSTSKHSRQSRTESYQLPAIPANRRGRDSDIEPVVNGMKCFGIGKSGIARAVVKFREPPQRKPYTLCFHFPATFLTHRYVLDMVRTKIHFVHNAKVTGIQYIDRNTIHGTQGLDNRWLITVSTVDARDELLRLGLHIYNRRITLRRYDDILQDEWREYQQYLELQKKLYVRLQEMAQVQKAANVQPSSHLQSMAEELRRALGMQGDQPS